MGAYRRADAGTVPAGGDRHQLRDGDERLANRHRHSERGQAAELGSRSAARRSKTSRDPTDEHVGRCGSLSQRRPLRRPGEDAYRAVADGGAVGGCAGRSGSGDGKGCGGCAGKSPAWTAATYYRLHRRMPSRGRAELDALLLKIEASRDRRSIFLARCGNAAPTLEDFAGCWTVRSGIDAGYANEDTVAPDTKLQVPVCA